MARTKKAATPATPAEVRAWARENDIPVSSRGRLSTALIADFTKATKREVTAATPVAETA